MIKGIGIDLVDHQRIKLILAKSILTKQELDVFGKHHNQIEFLASRFAAKEAIIKATNKQYLYKDINIFNNEDGSIATNINNINLSISHEQNMSIAIAIWSENE